MIKKIILLIINLALHVLAIALLAWAFWPFVDLCLRASMLVGYDTGQFFYYVHLFSQSHPLPPAGWDNLWYEGAPRVLNYVFLPHYLIQPLVAQLGLVMATKVYPLFWLGFFLLTCYFLFYRLSKNQLLAFFITLGVMYSKTIYQPIYLNGVVVSGLSNTIFPLILLFLVLYAQTKSFRYLALAALSLAFQLYNHPAMGLAFGFVSAFIFLFFLKFPEEKFISYVRVKRFLGFMLMTFGVAALTTFPQLLDATKSGSYGKSPFGQPLPMPLVFIKLIEFTHPSLLVVLGLSILVAIIFYRKFIFGLFLSFFFMLGYFLLFMAATKYGINPVGDFLFPSRVWWYFAVILGCLAALLFSPLTASYKSRWRFLLPFSWIIIGGIMAFVFVKNPFNLDDYRPFAQPNILSKEAGDKVLFGMLEQGLEPILKEVDANDTNFRIWNHSGWKITWNIISNIPQVEGYYNYMVGESGEWTAWFNATLAEEVVKNKTIPQDMAEKQGLFLIDWFATKYLYASPGEEFNLAPRFYQDNDYVLKKTADDPPAVFTIKPEFTSGIVEAVKVPVIGFVGSDDGYNIFLRDLGMLNLNTHYLIPLRLGRSINNVSKDDLGNLDLLVLYGLKNKGGDWRKIADFVKKGGSLFIETGGNSVFIEEENLPEIFPMTKLQFGSLGREWQVEKKGEISSVDFTKLKPLVYQSEPWKLSYVDDPTDLRVGSNVLLTQAGKPVVVEQILGRGKVIWAGLNSWYRPWELKENGMKEVEIIDVVLKKLLSVSYSKPVDVKISRDKSEKITVDGTDFDGIVVKEKNLPGWQAFAQDNNQKYNLKRYNAGPDFMYYPLPKDLRGKSVTVKIEYRGRFFYWFLFILSILSTIFVIEEIISGGFLSRKFSAFFENKIFNPQRLIKKMSGWWEKEEE